VLLLLLPPPPPPLLLLCHLMHPISALSIAIQLFL